MLTRLKSLPIIGEVERLHEGRFPIIQISILNKSKNIWLFFYFFSCLNFFVFYSSILSVLVNCTKLYHPNHTKKLTCNDQESQILLDQGIIAILLRHISLKF